MMRSNKPTPEEIGRMEKRVSRALHAQADSVRPSPNAYTRLAETVAAANQPSARRTLGLWARPAGFVTVTLAFIGLGAYLIAQQGSQAVDTVDAAPATADASDLFDGATEPAESGDPADPGPETDSGNDVAAAVVPDGDPTAVDDLAEAGPGGADDVTGGGYGVETRATDVSATYAPVKSTKLGAARAFLDLLDVDFAVPELEAGEVVVRALVGGGEELGPVISTLTVEEIAGGYLVTEARSDLVDFDLVNAATDDPSDDNIEDRAVVDDVIEISGVGSDLEGSLAFNLRSAIDGTVIESEAETAIAVDAEGRFTLTLPVVGSERAWVVVSSSADDDQADRAFAARSVLYTGPADPIAFTVVRLPPDDEDQGLVIRATPGGRRIGVIDLGDTGVHRRPIAPRKVGSHTWWAIETDDGRQGWVASLYLAPHQTVPTSTLLDLGRRLGAAIGNGDLSAEGISVSYPVLLGEITSPRAVYNSLDAPSTWVVTRNFLPTDEGGPTTLAEFLGVDRWETADVVVTDGYLDPAAEASARSYFGDLPSVMIRSQNPESLLWERVHIFFSRRGDHFSVTGIVREVEPVEVDVIESDQQPTPIEPDNEITDPGDR